MLAKIQESILVILMSVALFNVCMMIIHTLLGAIKNMTASKVDNKVWKFIGKVIAGLQKAIDYGVANKAHK